MPTEPDHYLLIAASVEWEPFTSARDIVRALAERNLWLASRFTPFRRAYKAGDRVLLYASGVGHRCIMADGTIAGPVAEATAEDKRVAEELGLEGFAERIPLREVRLWNDPLPMKPLVDELRFVKDKKNWGLGLRQAAVRLPIEDFDVLMKSAGLC